MIISYIHYYHYYLPTILTIHLNRSYNTTLNTSELSIGMLDHVGIIFFSAPSPKKGPWWTPEISGVVHGFTEFGRELLQRVVARKLQPDFASVRNCEQLQVENIWKKQVEKKMCQVCIRCSLFQNPTVRHHSGTEGNNWGLNSLVQVWARGKLPFGCAGTTAISAAARPLLWLGLAYCTPKIQKWLRWKKTIPRQQKYN